MEYDFTKIPLADVVSLGTRRMLHSDLFTVSWLLGRYCNYRCSYCWPYARSDTKDHRPTELCLLTIDEIKRQARENGFNSFHFSLSGGEPTFHPGYLDIMKYLADDVSNTNYTSVHMTSNCSRPMSWFEKYVEYAAPFHRASITASLHTEHLNSMAKMQEFADKLILCQHHDVQVTINTVMIPEWFDRDWDNALFFHNQGINVTLKPQSDPTASKVVDGYSDNQLATLHNGMPQQGFTAIKRLSDNRPKVIPLPVTGYNQSLEIEMKDTNGKVWYMDQAERFNAFDFNKFKGWECNSGYQSIVIREPDGSIKRSYSCEDVPLGNIETGFKLFSSPAKCISDNCVSSADSKIPKKK
jgi:organic radical activating enzyme